MVEIETGVEGVATGSIANPVQKSRAEDTLAIQHAAQYQASLAVNAINPSEVLSGFEEMQKLSLGSYVRIYTHGDCWQYGTVILHNTNEVRLGMALNQRGAHSERSYFKVSETPKFIPLDPKDLPSGTGFSLND